MEQHNLQEVYAVQCEGEWYIIPVNTVDAWNTFMSIMYDDDTENDCDDIGYVYKEFEEAFDKYSIGGDINLIPLYAKIK